ncbi:MAG: 30S ribosomal protein S12 methylthiotransferase RimO, partial [Clostridiales bacterium]|nr:30S ribosomal protein S12 methylthiotransferase RimO [Clostridiales bacterium]
MAVKVAMISLGCPKNQVDSEVMLAKLKDAGMEIVIDDIDADVVVVNTCAFIADAKKESIDTILDVAWLKEHRNLKGIVAAGCLVQRYKDELFSELPEIDAAIGIGDLESIVDAVNQAYESGVGKKEDKYSVVTRAENQILGGDRVVTGPEYSVYLKIAEGCDNHCTFCAIP